MGNDIQIAAHRLLACLGGGGGTLGTNSHRFSCSIVANKPAASNCRSPQAISSYSYSTNQRLVNNYLCTSKLQTHEIEIRHRHKQRQTQRQRQRDKGRQSNWKWKLEKRLKDSIAKRWCPTASPSKLKKSSCSARFNWSINFPWKNISLKPFVRQVKHLDTIHFFLLITIFVLILYWNYLR